ncbi:MAG TPA: serine hydrolase, partial [Acidobacteriota bacterium]|nr:serine hydrolase [Acidobacteriota bacterium]
RDLGEEFQYQNLMFMTAGYLAERITGDSWEDLVRERIFAPLAMERTNFSVLASQRDADHALPYALEDRAAQLIPFRNIDTIGPAGSINSSVSEMSQWMRLQLGGGVLGGLRLLETATLQEMHTPHMAISSYPSSSRTMTLGYGLGWSVEAHRGHFVVQHGGGIDGFISWVALLPLDKLGVVVYTNASGANPVPPAVARTVIDRILGLDDAGYLTEALEDVEEGEKALAEARANAEAKRKGGTRPTHALTEYAGRYDHVGYGVIEVTADDARLRLEYNSMPTDLEHWHYNTFNGADGGEDFEDLKVLFRLDADGEIVELAVPFEAQMDPIVFTKLADERLSDPDYLAQFVGIYELSGQRAEVMLQGTALRVALPGQPVYTLEPKRGTEFGIGNLSGFSLEFLLDNSGAVTAARFIQPNGVFEGKRVEE